MEVKENASRAKRNKQIREGTYDLTKLEIPRHWGKEVEKNLKLIERYAKEKGLSEKELKMLKEIEIMGARQAYLVQRNEENKKNGGVFAIRDTKYNNEEIEILDEQYHKRQEVLGKHVDGVTQFIEKQNQKTNGR